MGKKKVTEFLAKKGLGLLGKKKTLTVDKGAARIAEINRKIKAYKGPKQYITEDYVQEVADIYAGKWKGKK